MRFDSGIQYYQTGVERNLVLSKFFVRDTPIVNPQSPKDWSLQSRLKHGPHVVPEWSPFQQVFSNGIVSDIWSRTPQHDRQSLLVNAYVASQHFATASPDGHYNPGGVANTADALCVTYAALNATRPPDQRITIIQLLTNRDAMRQTGEMILDLSIYGAEGREHTMRRIEPTFKSIAQVIGPRPLYEAQSNPKIMAKIEKSALDFRNRQLR